MTFSVPCAGGTHYVVASQSVLAGVVVFEGDSLTAGYDPNNGTDDTTVISPPHQFAIRNPSALVTNVAGDGDEVVNMIGEASTQVTPRYDSSKPFNVASIWGGTNDMVDVRTAAETYANISTWCTARRSTGFKVICSNTIRRVDLNETKRTSLNAMLAAGHSFCDALVDLSALLGDWTTNPSYWEFDQIHITSAGTAVVAAAWETAIRGIL